MRDIFRVVFGLNIASGMLFGVLHVVPVWVQATWYADLVQVVELIAVSISISMVLGALMGGILGGVLSIRAPHNPAYRWIWGVGIGAIVQFVLLLLPSALVLYNTQQWEKLYVFGGIALLSSLIIWMNTRYWIRKMWNRHVLEQQGEVVAISTKKEWQMLAIAAIMCAIVEIAAFQNKGYGGQHAVVSDPDVVVISLDGVGYKNIEQGKNASRTPNIDALSGKCAQYSNAISVFTENLPGQVAMLTGLHPAQIGVFSAEDTLSPQANTITEKLASEGYATGLFVSNPALVGTQERVTGLEQGFQLVDGDVHVGGAYWMYVPILSLLQSILLPTDSLRPASNTFAQARRWLEKYSTKPALTWMQVQIPDGLNSAEYATQLQQIDRETGEFIRFLQQRSSAVSRKTVVVVTSSYGMTWNSKDIGIHQGITEDVIRVPLIMCLVKNTDPNEIKEQVRTLDIANSLYAQLGFSHVQEISSVNVTNFTETLPQYQTLLVGKDPHSLHNSYVVGWRLLAKNSTNLYKYHWYTMRRLYAIYNISQDTWEENNLVFSTGLEMARALGQSTMDITKNMPKLDIASTEYNIDNLSGK